MRGKRDIYLVDGRETVHIDLRLTREQHAVLLRLAQAFERSVSDLIREGVTIIIDGYYHPLLEVEDEKR